MLYERLILVNIQVPWMYSYVVSVFGFVVQTSDLSHVDSKMTSDEISLFFLKEFVKISHVKWLIQCNYVYGFNHHHFLLK